MVYFVLPALAGKNIGITLLFVVVCCEKKKEHLALPSTCFDGFQPKLGHIDATREPSFLNEVKGHISRSKVIWGQVVR